MKVKIGHTEPVGQGWNQRVYELPGNPNLLAKVPKETTKPIVFYLGMKSYLRIIKAVERVHSQTDGDLLIARYFGRVQTDLGRGFLVQRIADANGMLSRNLSDLAQSGDLAPGDVAALNRFVDTVVSIPIVARDLNQYNLLAMRGDKRTQILIVDGVGDDIIPFKTMCPRFARHRLRRKFEALAAMINLKWNGAQFY